MGNQLIGKERMVMNIKCYSKSLKINFGKLHHMWRFFAISLGTISIINDLDKIAEKSLCLKLINIQYDLVIDFM